MLSKLAGAALLFAATASAQPAPQPAAPAPAEKWHIDGSGERCMLKRRLEGSPVPATFLLRTIPGSNAYELMLAATNLPPGVRRARKQALVTLQPGKSFTGEVMTVRLGGELGSAVAMPNLPRLFVETLGQAALLQLNADGKVLAEYRLPAPARAAEAFAWCERQKQIEWGADASGFEKGATPPKPASDVFDWVPIGVIHTRLMREFRSLGGSFRLNVGPDGRVERCGLVDKVGSARIEEDVCKSLTARARFEPARDRAGRPVRGIAIYSLAVGSSITT